MTYRSGVQDIRVDYLHYTLRGTTLEPCVNMRCFVHRMPQFSFLPLMSYTWHKFGLIETSIQIPDTQKKREDLPTYYPLDESIAFLSFSLIFSSALRRFEWNMQSFLSPFSLIKWNSIFWLLHSGLILLRKNQQILISLELNFLLKMENSKSLLYVVQNAIIKSLRTLARTK